MGFRRLEEARKDKRGFMAIPLDPKQIVSFEELLMSQVVQQEALTRLLVEKGIFTKQGFLKTVKVICKKKGVDKYGPPYRVE